MKKSVKILIAVLSVIMTCIVFVAVGCKKDDPTNEHVCESVCSECGKCTNPSCKEDACKEKCQGHEEKHKCSSKCSVCGKCLNYDCEDEACKDKCGTETDKVRYVFEGEDSHVIRNGGSLGALGTAKEEKYGATETYISNFNANLGASIIFNLYVENETTANLFVSVCKRMQPTVFTNNVAVVVNKNQMLDSPSIVPSNGRDKDTWTEFVDVNLGCVQLKAGKNEIKLSIMDAEATAGYNVNNISVRSSVPVSWYEGAHECETACSVCGKCTDYTCKDSACADKCEDGWSHYEFSATSSNAVAQNAAIDGESLVLTDKSSGVRFKLSASKAAYASLSVVLEKGESDIAVSELLNSIAFNGNAISSDAVLSASAEGSFVAVKVGYISLNEDSNVFYVGGNASQSVKIKGISVNTTAELDWLVSASNYIFEAEDAQSNAWATDTLWKVNDGTASGGKYVGHVFDVAGQGYYLLFTVHAEEDCEATLYLGLGAALTFSANCLPITINDTPIAFDTTITATDWTKFVEREIGTVNLKKGNNTVKVKIGAGAATNIDYLGFYCEKKLSVGQEVEIHTCTSKCSICHKCTNSECLDDACKDKCQGHEESDKQKIVFEAETAESNAWAVDTLWKMTDRPETSGGKYVGHIGDVAGQGYYLSFDVYAAEDCTATLLYCLGTGTSINSNVIALSVNGSDVETDATCNTGGWFNFSETEITSVNLQKGKNTIKITFNDGCLFNMDYLALESEAVLSATELAE